MTIEQRPELNRFVDPSIPLTWGWRWRQIKMTLPIWVFIFACFFETGLLKAWLTDRLNGDFILTLTGVLVSLFLFIWGTIEIQVRLLHRSKRVLRIEDNRIVVSLAKNQSVDWKNVARFQ